jgi:mitosis inhibitor protein kinase SWE1
VRFQGLEFIHESGVTHLDLKPANIFITVEDRFKIGDFGMASLWPRSNHKAVGAFEGNGAFEREGDKVYLALEVLQGNYGKAADIFRFVLNIFGSMLSTDHRV